MRATENKLISNSKKVLVIGFRSIFEIPYIAALRPHQWTKNLVVFAAPLFAFSINWQTFLGSLLAFSLFCFTSSSFYLINDLVDIESDRRHPVKCKRPIAAGLVSIPAAASMALILMAGTLTVSWSHSLALGAVITGYIILQIAYNLKLKRVPILDIAAIATGFILRAISGAAANELPLSVWFVLCTAMLALFLGIEKRKAELRLLQIGMGKTRSVLKRYSLPLLTRMESTVTTSTIMSYALWSSGPVVEGASTPWMLLTLPFVMYGIFRYQLLSDTAGREAQNSSTERPEEILLKDRHILFTVVAWGGAIFIILLIHEKGLI